jgi:CBS domain containing-hemolysin-like protein
MLLDASREHGTLPAADEQLLQAMLNLQNTPIDTVMVPAEAIVSVQADAPAEQVERVAQALGRSRRRSPTTPPARSWGWCMCATP